nr:hypothetical protein Itr_chr05CG09150 [Ipomoea trifida]
MVLLHCTAVESSLLTPDGGREGSPDNTVGSSLHRCLQSPPEKTEMRKEVDRRRGGHCCSSLEESQGRHCSAREEPELPPVKAARREHIYMLCFATGDADATLEG